MSGEPYQIIGRNALFSILRAGVAFPVMLVLVPIIIGSIGSEAYGVWVLVQVVSSYIGLADLGIGATITKYTAEYEARREYGSIQELLGTCIVLYGILGALLCLVVAWGNEWIIRTLFHGTGEDFQELPMLLVISAVVFAVNLTFGVFLSILNGLQRMDVANGIGIIVILSNFVASILLLHLGYRVGGLVAANAMASAIGIVLSTVSVSRLAPYLNLMPHRFLFSLVAIRRVWSFSAYGAVGTIMAMVYFQVDKLFISYFLGLTTLAYYDVSHRLVSLICTGFVAMIAPVMPAVSRVCAVSGEKKAREIFVNVFRCVASMAAPMFMAMAIFAEVVIRVWQGGEQESSVLALRFLSCTYLISMLTAPGAFVLTGMALLRYQLIGVMIASISVVALNLFLVPIFQLQGVLMAGLLAYGLAAIYQCHVLSVVMKPDILKEIVGSAAVPMTVALIILLVMKKVGGVIDAEEGRLFFSLVGFSVLYVTWLVSSRRLDEMLGFVPAWRQFRGLS